MCTAVTFISCSVLVPAANYVTKHPPTKLRKKTKCSNDALIIRNCLAEAFFMEYNA